MFLETSALTGENVEEGFLKCARTILNKIDSGEHGLFSTSSPSVRASQLPGVGCSELGCVWQVSWTQRGWALGFSMETHHWGSYGSREAPPHRINSSAVARDLLALIHKPPRTVRPLQVGHWYKNTTYISEHSISSRPLCRLCHPTSQLQVFFGVREPSSLQSHTPLTTWKSSCGAHRNPFTFPYGNPRRNHTGIREKRKIPEAVSRVLDTWTTQGSCVRAVVHLFSFYVLCLWRYSIFAHISLEWLSVCCFVHTQWSCQNVIHHCWLVFLAF